MLVKTVFLSVLLFSGTCRAAPAVVASIAPVHSIVSAVMAGGGEPELLLNPAVSPHDYALKPSDMRKLANAGLVIWGGAALESFLPKSLEAAGVEGKSVAVLSDKRLTVLSVAGGTETDGHFWLMPSNMAVVAEIAAENLGRIDPDNKTLYAKNAAQVAEGLRALLKKGEKKLAPYKNKPFVTFHDAFGYFERAFGVSSLGALHIDAHHASGARALSELRDKIKAAGKVCLFSEPQFSDKAVTTAARGLNVETGVLDPMGAGVPAGVGFYDALMNGLFDSLTDCLKRIDAP